jgi:glycerol-3-phosphate acyltransferase PlsX
VSAVIRIAIDCMGGDSGLPVTIPAAFAFAQRFSDTHLLLVGLSEPIKQAVAEHAKQYPDVSPDRMTIVAATEVVHMDDSVEIALRRKKDSSMRVAAQAVKDNKADACVSAGNTGAWMGISKYVLKTLDGIDRPAIASVLPNQLGGTTIMLDLGANVDCSAQHLLQFAIMGTAFAQVGKQNPNPSIGLLNIGEEAIKGNDVVKQAGELLRNSSLNFYGNVEGDDIFKGTVDVVVCDGFVGNVALKTAEGVVRMMSQMLREAFTRSLGAKVLGLVALPVLRRFRAQADNRRYNGAALLGLRGVVIKSHGSADAIAFGFALDCARASVANHLLSRTTAAIAQLTQTQSLDATDGTGDPA